MARRFFTPAGTYECVNNTIHNSAAGACRDPDFNRDTDRIFPSADGGWVVARKVE